MSKTRIPRALRRDVTQHFHGRCAYCHTATAITGAHLVVDHILPESAGGKTVFGNLCLACHACNELKSARLDATDPVTDERVPLFHPHQDVWIEHFAWSDDGSEIIGRTPVGRATVGALNMNHPAIVQARRRWTRVGWHPPSDDPRYRE